MKSILISWSHSLCYICIRISQYQYKITNFIIITNFQFKALVPNYHRSKIPVRTKNCNQEPLIILCTITVRKIYSFRLIKKEDKCLHLYLFFLKRSIDCSPLTCAHIRYKYSITQSFLNRLQVSFAPLDNYCYNSHLSYVQQRPATRAYSLHVRLNGARSSDK